MDGLFKATFGIEYSVAKTEGEFLHTLSAMVDEGPTVSCIPWRLVGRMGDFLARPEASFDYAEFVQYCRAESARNLLRPAMYLSAELVGAALRRKIHFPAVFFGHLKHCHQEYLLATRAPGLPRCVLSNPADNMPGSSHPPPEIRDARRAVAFIAKRTAHAFQRTMGLIGLEEDDDQISSGRKIRDWATGAGAPEDRLVPVDILHNNGRIVIGPRRAEAAAILRLGFAVPAYAVSPALVSTPSAVPPAAPAAPKRAAPAFAARGPRFEISAAYDSVHDRQTDKRYTVSSVSEALALQVFVEMANGRAHAQKEADILDRIKALRAERKLREAETMNLQHHFRTRVAGRRVLSPLYGLLIHNIRRQGVYWLEL